MKHFRKLVGPYCFWLFVLTVVPMFLIMIYAFVAKGNNVATYQITVNKSLVDEEALAREQAEQEQRQRMIIGAVIAVVVVIAIIVFVIIRRRRNRAFAEEYSGVPFYGMNKDDDDIDEYDEDYEEKPKALKKKRKFIEEEEDDYQDSNLNDEYNTNDDFEDEKEDYEKENEKIMSTLQDDEEERARRERVRAKFLDGYSKSMTDREENSNSRTYNKFDDGDDLDDKAEAFASRVKRNSKGRRFKE